MKKQTVELIAPAGSFESLRAALDGGADAVYFGVEQLNMRARSANNFCLDDLALISKTCKKAGVKTYIALNTVLYDHDIRLATDIIKKAKKDKIDAVIVSDPAVLEICERLQMPVHISTQLNVSNLSSVRFFSRYADLMVLARELTLTQVKNICRTIKKENICGPSGRPVQIEVFAHGALCMAISGKCYLSLHTQNASANRGACTQNCRHAYKVTSLETNDELIIDNQFIMSPKDLCTINILDEIIVAGVSALKIEGRSKSADYVYTVTKCYREAIGTVQSGNYTPEKIDSWMKQLSTVFNRGFWEGYYLGRQLGEWTSAPGSLATEKKIYIGKGIRYYPRKKIAEFLIEAGNLKKGETVLVIGAKSGVRRSEILEMRIDGLPGEQIAQGQKLTIPLDEKIYPSDKLYKLVSA